MGGVTDLHHPQSQSQTHTHSLTHSHSLISSHPLAYIQTHSLPLTSHPARPPRRERSHSLTHSPVFKLTPSPLQVILLALPGVDVPAVAAEVHRQLSALPRASVASRAIANSCIIAVESREEALRISNEYAPEVRQGGGMGGFD